MEFIYIANNIPNNWNSIFLERVKMKRNNKISQEAAQDFVNKVQTKARHQGISIAKVLKGMGVKYHVYSHRISILGRGKPKTKIVEHGAVKRKFKIIKVTKPHQMAMFVGSPSEILAFYRELQ